LRRAPTQSSANKDGVLALAANDIVDSRPGKRNRAEIVASQHDVLRT
jgi:hypothetical protein